MNATGQLVPFDVDAAAAAIPYAATWKHRPGECGLVFSMSSGADAATMHQSQRVYDVGVGAWAEQVQRQMIADADGPQLVLQHLMHGKVLGVDMPMDGRMEAGRRGHAQGFSDEQVLRAGRVLIDAGVQRRLAYTGTPRADADFLRGFVPGAARQSDFLEWYLSANLGPTVAAGFRIVQDAAANERYGSPTWWVTRWLAAADAVGGFEAWPQQLRGQRIAWELVPNAVPVDVAWWNSAGAPRGLFRRMGDLYPSSGGAASYSMPLAAIAWVHDTPERRPNDPEGPRHAPRQLVVQMLARGWDVVLYGFRPPYSCREAVADAMELRAKWGVA